jgi:proteasome assembly chaperone (PAC2) family protein
VREPVLVAGFTGWNDAADAASDALAWLAGHYGAQRFATLDPEEHIDFQAIRPTVELLDGVTRSLRWPSIRFEHATTADPGTPDLLLLSGPEPNLRWRGFSEAVITVARETGARMVVTFGALLADAPHTRPVRVTGTTTDGELMGRLALTQSRYEGPTGIVGVIHDACRTAGIRSASLWATVPHYVATPPNPPAIRALLERFGRLTGTTLDLRELGVAGDAWRARVDGAVAADEDLRDYVLGLEEQLDDQDDEEMDVDPVDLPDGDAIAEAFEQYLREQEPPGS